MIVIVAELIAPSVAPPTVWLERQVDRRITGRAIGVIQNRNREALRRVTKGAKVKRARDARVILTGDGRAVRRGVTHRDGHVQIAGPDDLDRGSSRPSRRRYSSAAEKAIVAACAEMALEKADVSPVLSFVASAVTQRPDGQAAQQIDVDRWRCRQRRS